MREDVHAYADETGHEEDPNRRVFGLAGFLGSRRAWDDFSARWDAACPRDDRPFHMKQFLRKYRTDAEQRPIMGPLVNSITQSKLVPISVVTSLEGQRRLGNPTKDIYFWMLSQFFGQVTMSVIEAADPHDPSNAPFPSMPRLSIIYARRRNAAWVENWWWEARKTANAPVSSLISHVFVESVSVASPEAVVPLEAADLLAYEVGHHYEVVLPNRRRTRFPFKQIMAMPPIPGVGIPHFNIIPSEILKNPYVALW